MIMDTKNTAQNYLTDIYAKAYPETTPFWEAAEQNKFLLKSCSDCKRPHWYPRVICPMCGSSNTLWTEASGKGTLYTFSINEKANPPYVLAYVQLEEGPTIMSNIIDYDVSKLQIGAAVEVHFQATKDGRSMPFFRLS